jgi:beta-xylosidase
MPSRFTNPAIGGAGGADHGDPFALRHHGEYFLYHTTDDGDRGISVHRSRDLVRWSFAGSALEPAAGRRPTSGRPRWCTPAASS